MKDELDQPGVALALAIDIAAKLERQLNDFDAEVVTISRGDAVIAFGLVNAVIDSLRNRQNH